VLALPVLPRRRDKVRQTIEELKRREVDEAVGSRPRGLPPATGPTQLAALFLGSTSRSGSVIRTLASTEKPLFSQARMSAAAAASSRAYDARDGRTPRGRHGDGVGFARETLRPRQPWADRKVDGISPRDAAVRQRPFLKTVCEPASCQSRESSTSRPETSNPRPTASIFHVAGTASGAGKGLHHRIGIG
jgi:hypothetical protein